MTEERLWALYESISTMLLAIAEEIDVTKYEPCGYTTIGTRGIRYIRCEKTPDGGHIVTIEDNLRNIQFDWQYDLTDAEREEINNALALIATDSKAYTDGKFRICSICGLAFHDGYYLTDAYCCSDECRNEYYKRSPYNCNTDDEAEHEYLWQCYEIDSDEVSHEEWMQRPIEECRNFSETVGDVAFFSDWY